MKLFKKEKKKCCCQKTVSTNTPQKSEVQNDTGIKILGSGCAKCVRLEEAVKSVVEELHLDITIEHIQDFVQIASYGVMSTPALVLNGKVLSYGKVLTSAEIKELLNENL